MFLAHPLGAASLAVLLILVLAGALAAVLAPHPPDRIDLGAVRIPPGASTEHLLGTDALGRDHLSRLLFGLRTSVTVALCAAVVSTALGIALGGLAGYAGGPLDGTIMRMTDLVLSLPALAVVLAAAELSGAEGPIEVGLVLALLLWPRLARGLRAALRSLRQEEFVLAARGMGAGALRIVVRELLPNTVGLVVAHVTLAFAVAILAEGALSFLGFGIQPPTPTLGNLIRETRGAELETWWLAAFPGLAIALLCLAVTYVGDAFREAFEGEGRPGALAA